jgi:hypothetical protein
MTMYKLSGTGQTPNWAFPTMVGFMLDRRSPFGHNFLAPLFYWYSTASHYGCLYSGLARDADYRPSIDEEYELTAHVPGSALFQRLGRSL